MVSAERRPAWRLAAISAIISAGLGVAIAFAADLKSNPWAWLAVGLLTSASIAASISAESIKRRRSEVRARAAATTHVGDSFESSGSKIDGPTLVRGDFVGRDMHRDVHYHGQPLLRTVIAVSMVVWLTAAGGLIAGAWLYSPTRPAASNAENPSESTLGTLTMYQAVRNFYPKDGILPTLAPPPYDHNDVQQLEDFCGIWTNWAGGVQAASDMPIMSLTTIAGATSPITILDMRAVVYAQHPMANNKYLRCQFGAGGYVGTTANIDLDHPSAPTQMDIGADGQQHTTLPGGRFAVDPKNAESLYIYLSGSPGVVYEYGIELKVVENSREETRTFGSADQPYRLAFGDSAPGEYYDWDYSLGQWVPADPNVEPK